MIYLDQPRRRPLVKNGDRTGPITYMMADTPGELEDARIAANLQDAPCHQDTPSEHYRLPTSNERKLINARIPFKRVPTQFLFDMIEQRTKEQSQ